MAVPVIDDYVLSALHNSASTFSATLGGEWSSGLCLALCSTWARSPTGTPSGWTELLNSTQWPTGINVSVYYKALASGDAGTDFELTLNATSNGYVVLLQISGHDETDPFPNTPAVNAESEATTVTSPSITTTEDDSLIIRLLTGNDGSHMTISSSSGDDGSLVVQPENGTCYYQTSVYESTKASAGATGTASYTYSQAILRHTSATIAIAPASGGDPATGFLTLTAGGQHLIFNQ